MASRHEWNPLRIAARAGEPQDLYTRRRAEIEAIVEGFRWGRFSARESERLEAKLQQLLRR